MADVIDDLEWRGLIAQSTDRARLREVLSAGPVAFYCGFDPTAASLHVGNLLQILTARRLQVAGHKPILLVGGATGLVGDPKQTGERVLNSEDVVRQWSQRIGSQLRPFFDFDGGSGATMVNNLDWTVRLSAIELLRDLGKHFSVNLMLDREAVAARLSGTGISFTEFSYQVLQANDFLELHRSHECVLQTGGSDQWGNIIAGIDLVRRVDGAHVHGLTTPLVTKADGTKFGKTESATVWLDPELTSPYAFYQFWIHVDDRDVPTLLRTFSLRARRDVEQLERMTEDSPGARAAQRALAHEMTALVHGERQADAVEQASAALFGGGTLDGLAAESIGAALLETRTTEVSRGAVPPTVAEVAVQLGLVASKGAARRAAREGGLYVNNARVGDPDARLPLEQAIDGEWLILRRGKRHVAGARVIA